MADQMPVFTIKAKDALAVPALRAYRQECLDHGLDAQARQVGQALFEIEAWQRENIDATKLPDHPHVPVQDAVSGKADSERDQKLLALVAAAAPFVPSEEPLRGWMEAALGRDAVSGKEGKR